MKISFYSNYLNHHQIPFCNEMYHSNKIDYTFISMKDMEPERRELGWETANNYPFVLNVTKDKMAYQTAIKLAQESEVIIVGSAPDLFVTKRMSCQNEGITFYYSERFFKKGSWQIVFSRLLKRIVTCYRYRNRKLFMLCASAYTSADLNCLGSFVDKCYKWGYFPETIYYNLEELMANKSKDKTIILWCGRFLKLKHPEAAIALAIKLKQEDIDFSVDIIGSGEEENSIKTMILKNHLEGYVNLLGTMSPMEVRRSMEMANVFLFTSDFREGWGTVINEAMNSGCAVMSSHAAGSVPYLIKDEINGLIYKSGDIDSLYRKVKDLILNKSLCEELGKNAYETITEEWNAKEATKRLLLLIDDLIKMGSSDRFQSGPCSKAEIIENNWYQTDDIFQ